MKAGHSEHTGIVLYDTTLEAPNGVMGIYDGDEVVIREGDYRELIDEIKSGYTEPKSVKFKYNLIMAVLLIVMVVSIVSFAIWASASWIVSVVLFCVVTYIPILTLLFACINPYESLEDFMSFRRYHASEHIVLNHKNAKGWSLETVRKTSYYHSECGTVWCAEIVVLMVVIWVLIVNLQALGVGSALMILGGTIIVLIIGIFIPFNPLKLVQKRAVARPGDRELLLAITVMERFDQLRSEKRASID